MATSLLGGSVRDLFYQLKDLVSFNRQSLEPKSVLAVDDTTAFTDLKGFAIHAVTDTVIASITCNNLSESSTWDLTAITISAGDSIYIQFSALTPTSGNFLIYEK